MQWKNSATHYGCISKFLHWTLAACVIFMLALGLELSSFEGDGKKLALQIHKSLGIVVLALAVFFIAWRFYTKSPRLPSSMSRLAKAGAYANCATLYALMIGMPVTGWAMNSAFGKPVIFLGLVALPDLVEKNLRTALLLKDTHSFIGFAMIGLVGLHIAAALYHHLVLKDQIMKRLL